MKALDELRFRAACAYVRLYDFIKDRWDRNLVGMGFALRRIGHERVLEVRGRRLFFDPRLASAYARLVIGRWEELETHALLHAALAAEVDGVHFTDVGANIGSFVLDMATHPRVRGITALEPQPLCADVIRRTAALNGWSHVEVVQAAVTDEPGTISFEFDDANPVASRIGESSTSTPVQAVTLDSLLHDKPGPGILLIDVEGAEPRVLRGALAYIERERPLIIFEYNYVSREHYHVDEVRALLGPDYEIYRLRTDGRLDERVEQAWNAVAVHATSPFHAACRRLVVSGSIPAALTP